MASVDTRVRFELTLDVVAKLCVVFMNLPVSVELP